MLSFVIQISLISKESVNLVMYKLKNKAITLLHSDVEIHIQGVPKRLKRTLILYLLDK